MDVLLIPVAGGPTLDARQATLEVIASAALEKSRVVVASSRDEAVEIANRYAPEHLILQVARPRDLLPGIATSGSVFLGSWTPESLGDYASGTNHVLPTYGWAHSKRPKPAVFQ